MFLLSSCVFVFAVHIYYWIILTRGFARARSASGSAEMHAPGPPVAVVVAARNEAGIIYTLMTALAGQTQRPADVVLVDDGSSDDTKAAALEAAGGNLPLRVLREDRPGGSKKLALTAGIRNARAEIIAFTDADCAPPPRWIEKISAVHAAAAEGPLLLVGYSPLRAESSLLNRFARYETFVTGFLTAAAIGLGRPYMAVGRNLSYDRRLFASVGGFEHSLHVRSGDDDLFVQHVARRGAAEVRALLDPETFVPTEAPSSWGEWFRQKRRHISASRYYAGSARVHLSIFQGSGLAVWFFPLILGWIGIALLGIRLGIQYGVLRHAAKALREFDLMSGFLPFELTYALYNLLLVPISLAKMPQKW